LNAAQSRFNQLMSPPTNFCAHLVQHQSYVENASHDLRESSSARKETRSFLADCQLRNRSFSPRLVNECARSLRLESDPGLEFGADRAAPRQIEPDRFRNYRLNAHSMKGWSSTWNVDSDLPRVDGRPGIDPAGARQSPSNALKFNPSGGRNRAHRLTPGRHLSVRIKSPSRPRWENHPPCECPRPLPRP